MPCPFSSRVHRILTGSAGTQASSDVASSYASALLELASATGSLEAIHADMDALEGVCNDELMTFLVNPLMEQKKKEEILKKVASEGQFSQATANFLQLLVAKRRIAFLKEIIEEFDGLYCEATDTQVGEVSLAPSQTAAHTVACTRF